MWYTKKGIARTGLLLGIVTGTLVLVASLGDGWGTAVGWGLLTGFGIAAVSKAYASLFGEKEEGK